MSRIGTIIGAVGLVLLVLVLVLQLVALLPGSAASGTLQEPSGITVMAQGEASGEPDLAMITIGVQTRDAEARTAAEKNDSRMNEVIGALLELGVAGEDIQTVDYSVRAEIDWDDDEQRVIGYLVSNSVLVKLREVDGVGDVLDAVTAAGANNIGGNRNQLAFKSTFSNNIGIMFDMSTSWHGFHQLADITSTSNFFETILILKLIGNRNDIKRISFFKKIQNCYYIILNR